LGDYYPLLPYSRDLQTWIAWQFDRPDLGTGAMQVFRRPNSPFESAKFPLHSLDPQAAYVVTDLDHADRPREMSGRQLMENGIEIRLDASPAAAIRDLRDKKRALKNLDHGGEE